MEISRFRSLALLLAVASAPFAFGVPAIHFDDEAQRYKTGHLREVYFHRSQLKGHTEREYHPGS